MNHGEKMFNMVTFSQIRVSDVQAYTPSANTAETSNAPVSPTLITVKALISSSDSTLLINTPTGEILISVA